MKTIRNYLVILVFLAMLSGGQSCLFAAEEVSSIMCDEGVVRMGDMDADVRGKCGNPSGGDSNRWEYDFGPSEPSYTVIFSEGKVVRILEEKGN
jgi:hypothetical protein